MGQHTIEWNTSRGGNEMDNHLFKNVEKKTGVNMGDIMQIAQSLQSTNLQDEQNIRNVIRKVSQVANKPVAPELENQIIQSILKDGKTLDFNTISKMMNKK